jgi:hypothetical protein
LKRILVTGARAGRTREDVQECIRFYGRFLGKGGPVHIIEGGANGVDTDARLLAQARNWQVTTVNANWNQAGKRAGPERNQAMVDLGADLCLAFPVPGSVGTFDCAARAERAGITVIFNTAGTTITSDWLEIRMRREREELKRWNS